MFHQHRQSLRNLFGNSSRHQALGSATDLSKKMNMKQRDSFRQTLRDRRKHRTRLKYCIEIMRKSWKATIDYDKKDSTYKVSTPDGRFHFLASVPNSGRKISRITSKLPSLSLSTRIYSCASDDPSIHAVKKILETNAFLGRDYGDYKYEFSIDDSRPSITIDLCCSHPVTGLFEGTKCDEFFSLVKNFVTIAFRVKKKLVSTFEGRLGMTPMTCDSDTGDNMTNASHFEFLTSAMGKPKMVDDDGQLRIIPMSLGIDTTFQRDNEGRLGILPRYQTNDMSHIAFLSSPPCVVSQFLRMVVKSSTNKMVSNWTMLSPSTLPAHSSSLSAAIIGGNHPIAHPSGGSKVSKPRGILQKPKHSKRARKLLSQFPTQEEAQVFELYMRMKHKRHAAKKNRRSIDKIEASIATKSTSTGSPVRPAKSVVTHSTTDSPRPMVTPKRMDSLPMTMKPATVASIASPKHMDLNRTPLISNKRLTGIANDDIVNCKRILLTEQESPMMVGISPLAFDPLL